MVQYLVVFGYLVIIVSANILTATFGEVMIPITSFLMIGYNITARDYLHDQWQGNRIKLGLLIVGGSVITILVSQDALRIAIASATAFLLAETVDTLIYERIHHLPFLQRANGSNVVSALVDTLVFTSIAFGVSAPILGIMIVDWIVKVAGGFVWSSLFVMLITLAQRRHPVLYS